MGLKFFSKSIFSQKGFIGPIGDDLPSLVPIVVALLLFFSIFAMTLNSYNSKNDEIRKQIEMTSIARELKGDSLINDVSEFTNKCEELKIKKFPYNFIVAIYDTSSVDTFDVATDFAEASINSTDLEYPNSDSTNFLKQPLSDSTKKAFFCSYYKAGGKEFSVSKKNYLLRFYPVAVQFPKTTASGETYYLIVPGLMAMVFWE